MLLCFSKTKPKTNLKTTNIFKLNIINVHYVFIIAYYNMGYLFIIVFKIIFCISILGHLYIKIISLGRSLQSTSNILSTPRTSVQQTYSLW